MGMIVGLLMLPRTPRSCSKANDLVLGICSDVGCIRNGYLNTQYGRGHENKVLNDDD